jgi:hypothetical protein
MKWIAALAIGAMASLGVNSAQADIIVDFTGTGFFTMITPTGGVLSNPDSSGNAYYGFRTELSGLTMQMNLTTGQGTGNVDPFLFSGTLASAHDVNMQAIGNGSGGPGTLVFGSILFDYGPTTNIPVYLVADAAGLFGAAQGGLSVGQVINTGAVTTTDAPVGALAFAGYMPNNGLLGGIPFAMTTLDVNQDGDIGNICGTADSVGNGTGTGALINGGFPLCDDGDSGVRMATAPFPGHGANFDMTSLTVTNIEDTGAVVPEPMSMALVGSSLIGLIALRRRMA